MKSIVILGNYSINLDIFGKTEDEIRRYGEPWVLNFWHKSYKIKPDLIFNIHNNFFKKVDNKYTFNPEDIAKLASAYNSAKCRVVIVGANDYIDSAEQFDIDGAVSLFGPDVFTSSITYEMAYAYMTGVSVVTLWGFNMINDIEYEPQIPAVLHMMETLEKRGMTINAPMRQRWMDEAVSRGVEWSQLPKIDKMYHEKWDGMKCI